MKYRSDNCTRAPTAPKCGLPIRAAVVLANVLMTPLAAHAQEGATADASQATLEEVIVTAQKREERLQDVPISILALSGDELRARNITSVDDLTAIAPGVVVEDNGESRNIYIRGIGNNAGNFPLVGQYLDEAPLDVASFFQIDPTMSDLKRIEVLRGPQGTLYGQGSVGGTIRYITNSPDLTRFDLTADAAQLFTQDGAPSERVSSVLNAPLVSDQFGIRVAGTFRHDGGWVDQPATGAQNINDGDFANLRLKALWQPAPGLSIATMAIVNRNNYTPNEVDGADGTFSQVFNRATTPRLHDDYEVYNAKIAYDLPGVNLISSTTYLDQRIRLLDEGVSVTSFGNYIADFYTPDHLYGTQTTSEEIRAASSGTGPFKWTIGAFYRDFHLHDEYATGFYYGPTVPAGDPLPGAGYPYHVKNGSRAESVFADVDYLLFERLTLGAGARVFWDHQNYSDLAANSFQEGNFNSTDPRAYLDYKASDSINLYASASKGFRSGGFNALNQPTFGPEQVWTYEGGVKTQFQEQHLLLNLAVFHSDYTNYQLFGATASEPVGITRNAGDVRIDGVEEELAWSPEKWRIAVNGTYVDARFTQIAALNTAQIVGDPVNYIPKYQVSGSLERHFSIMQRASSLRLDYSQVGKQEQIDRANGIIAQSGVVKLLSADFGIQLASTLRAQVFGQNLLNNRDIVVPNEYGRSPRSRPRTFGFELQYSLQ